MSGIDPEELPPRLRFLAGGGESTGRILARDWSGHVLGRPEDWADILKSNLSTILNSPESFILAWGREALTFFFNDAYARLLGPRVAWAMGTPFREVWADGWAQAEPIIDEAFAGRSQRFVDLPWRLATDRGPADTWFTFSYSRVLDAAGAVAGLLILTNETTEQVLADAERRRAGARLRESEERFRLMADAVPQIVWIIDAAGRVEFFNRQWSDYTGDANASKTAAEVTATHIHPDDAAITLSAFADAQASGGPFEVEHRIRSRTGAYRWFLVRAEPYRDAATGAIVRWFGASVDIHDRRLAEERLRDLNDTLEERVALRTAERNVLASLVETTDVLILAVALDYTILAINGANADEFERIYGVRPGVGDNLLALLADQPGNLEQVRAGWARGLAGECVTFVEDYGDPDRVRPYYEIKFRPLFDEAGKRIGTYQFATDVTDRLRREAQLATAQEALRQAQKMEAIGQLTGGIAHDFNNLLGAMVGSFDLILRRSADDARVRRWAENGLAAAERGAKLTGQLLAFARTQKLERKPVVVTDLIGDMQELLERSLGPMVRLRLTLAGRGAALSDSTQLEMAVLNLAINARDAMPDGGDLTIAAAGRQLADDPELEPGAYIEVAVSDSGTGMAPDVLARAFDPFFTTKGVGKGTGLGLSQVYALARQAGGIVRIESEPGQGTTVRLLLPATTVSAPVARGVTGGGRMRTASASILVVDDDPDIRRVIVDLAEALGYDVAHAADGPSALAMLEESTPDLLMLDFAMPVMNGAEVARRARARLPDLPIVFASGYSDTAAIESAVGADALIVRKPFRVEELDHILSKALSGRG